MGKTVKIVAFICILIGGSLLVPSSYAKGVDLQSGNGLSRFCTYQNHQQENQEWVYCVGHVTGIVEGMSFGIAVGALQTAHNKQDFNKGDSLLFCISNGVTGDQLALVVTKYLKNHPSKLNKDETSLVSSALAKAWPCNSG